MKKINVLMMAAATVLTVACGSGEENDAPEVLEDVVYNLDTTKTTLWWRGEENENHFRKGYVDVTEGSLTMAGDSVVGGSFKVDMNSISAEDDMPAEKIGHLNAHLKDTAFFQVYKYPTVDVTVSGYSNGKLNTTITVLGTDLKEDLPVTMTKTDDGVTFKGKFSIDFSSTDMEALKEINEETGEPGIQPVFDFELNLVLKK